LKIFSASLLWNRHKEDMKVIFSLDNFCESCIELHHDMAQSWTFLLMILNLYSVILLYVSTHFSISVFIENTSKATPVEHTKVFESDEVL